MTSILLVTISIFSNNYSSNSNSKSQCSRAERIIISTISVTINITSISSTRIKRVSRPQSSQQCNRTSTTSSSIAMPNCKGPHRLVPVLLLLLLAWPTHTISQLISNNFIHTIPITTTSARH